MSKYLNTIIMVSILSLVFGFLKVMWNVITGRTHPLKPKDEGTEDPACACLAPLDAPPSEDLLQTNAGNQCPLHNKPYVGITSIAFIEPKQMLNVFRQNAKVDKHLQIAVCEDCILTAHSLKASKFTWQRKNYRQHPSWSSTHILPHLLGSKMAKVISIKRKFSDDKWEECVSPKAKQAAAKGQTPDQLSVYQILDKYRSFLSHKIILMRDNIPAKKIQKVKEKYAPFGDEVPLLLIYEWADEGLLITDRKVYAKQSVSQEPTVISLRDIQTVQKVSDIYQDIVSNRIFVNGEQLWCFLYNPEEVVDFLVVLLKDLSISARQREDSDVVAS